MPPSPQRERLARWDQRHARDDGLQFQRWWIPTHPRWKGSDTDSCHSGRARGEYPILSPNLLRGFGDFGVLAAEGFAATNPAKNYRGRWFDENFKKDGGEDARPERIWEKQKAEAIVAKCAGKRGLIEEEKKSSTQIAPLLYDLTTLQREANSRFR